MVADRSWVGYAGSHAQSHAAAMAAAAEAAAEAEAAALEDAAVAAAEQESAVRAIVEQMIEERMARPPLTSSHAWEVVRGSPEGAAAAERYHAVASGASPPKPAVERRPPRAPARAPFGSSSARCPSTFGSENSVSAPSKPASRAGSVARGEPFEGLQKSRAKLEALEAKLALQAARAAEAEAEADEARRARAAACAVVVGELRASEAAAAQLSEALASARGAAAESAAEALKLRALLSQQGQQLSAALGEEQASRAALGDAEAARAQLAVDLATENARAKELTRKLSAAQERLRGEREAAAAKAETAAAEARAEKSALQQAVRAAQEQLAAEVAAKRRLIGDYQITKAALADARASNEQRQLLADAAPSARKEEEWRERLEAVRSEGTQLRSQLKSARDELAAAKAARATGDQANEQLAERFTAAHQLLEEGAERTAAAEGAAAELRATVADCERALDVAAAREAAHSVNTRTLLAELRDDDEGLVPLLAAQMFEVASMQVGYSELQRREGRAASRTAALEQQTEAMLARLSAEGEAGAGRDAEVNELRAKLGAAARRTRDVQHRLDEETRARMAAQSQLAAMQATMRRWTPSKASAGASVSSPRTPASTRYNGAGAASPPDIDELSAEHPSPRAFAPSPTPGSAWAAERSPGE